MSKRKKAPATKSSGRRSTGIPKVVTTAPIVQPFDATARYAEACKLASPGKHEEARGLYAEWQSLTADGERDTRLRALVHNDLAVMAAMDGRFDEARAEWKAALQVDQDCLLARLNRDLVEAEIGLLQTTDDFGELKLALAPAPMPSLLVGEGGPQGRMGEPGSAGAALKDAAAHGRAQFTPWPAPGPPPPYPSPIKGEGISQAGVVSAPVSLPVKSDGTSAAGVVGAPGPLTQAVAHLARLEPRLPGSARLGDSTSSPASGPVPSSRGSPVRVAILSFLFNWPSTGGGNHHTAELALFLSRAGYEVKHFFAQYPGWSIGRVSDPLISPSEPIAFDDAS